jgi:hypothetical protein
MFYLNRLDRDAHYAILLFARIPAQVEPDITRMIKGSNDGRQAQGNAFWLQKKKKHFGDNFQKHLKS